MILVDPPRWPAHGRLWSHLISDTSFDELHAFAAALGAPPRGFDRDHYDLPAERYEAALALGAQPVSSREIVAALHRSGLRRPRADRSERSGSTREADRSERSGSTREADRSERS
jgi:hypothetical protein